MSADLTMALLRASQREIATLPDDFADCPATCERCGLPFDRSGETRHSPQALIDTLAVTNPDERHENTHCPRFKGRVELWTCEGVRM